MAKRTVLCFQAWRKSEYSHASFICCRDCCVISALAVHSASFVSNPLQTVPVGSPSRGGDVMVYALDVNKPSFPTPFYSVLVSVSVFMALSTSFHFMNSPDNSSVFSLYSSALFSAILALSTTYLFMKVSLSPGTFRSGCLGSKHRSTNLLFKHKVQGDTPGDQSLACDQTTCVIP